jgi:hypothetical protein
MNYSKKIIEAEDVNAGRSDDAKVHALGFSNDRKI